MNTAYEYIRGKKVYAFGTKKEFLDVLASKKAILIALNAEKLNREDKVLEALIEDNIGYPDGIGAVLALKRKGTKAIKIPGAEFWLDIIEAYQKQKTFYFLGASDEVISKTIAKLKIDFPQIQIQGHRNGYLKEGDKEIIIAELAEKKPDIVFVAMGSPKQEFLMQEFQEKYPAIYMGLGGSFDVYSGLKKRAPKLFINLGLEWFYRLLKEPTRISRQLNLVKFFFKIIFGRL